MGDATLPIEMAPMNPLIFENGGGKRKVSHDYILIEIYENEKFGPKVSKAKLCEELKKMEKDARKCGNNVRAAAIKATWKERCRSKGWRAD